MPVDRDERIWVQLQHDAVDVAAATDFLRTPHAGGIDVFLGTTRQWTGEVETVELAYESYEAMAMREMRRLSEAACGRWPVLRVCLHHRLAVVPVGEVSVLVGVSTPHRAEAFDACRWLIDTLKRDVPIWKREHYRDGASAWVQGAHTPSEGAEGLPKT